MKGQTIITNGVVPTLCRQCDMRCGINARIEDRVITKISGLKTHRASRGQICPKAPPAIELVTIPQG